MANKKEAEEKLTPAEESRVSAAINLSKDQEQAEAKVEPKAEPKGDLTDAEKAKLAEQWKDDASKIDPDEPDTSHPSPVPPPEAKAAAQTPRAAGITCPRCTSDACSIAGGQRHCNQCGLSWN